MSSPLPINLEIEFQGEFVQDKITFMNESQLSCIEEEPWDIKEESSFINQIN